MAVASLVLGIISLLLMFTGWFAIIGTILGIIGIVLGVLGRKNLKAENQPTGVATAGMVMSIISTALTTIAFLACAACATALTSGAAKEFEKSLNDPKFKENLKKEMDDPKFKEELKKEMEKSLKEEK